jgi:two-component system, OmpR family, sensor kinase
VGGQRRLLSDVSHQLRTPLTVARGHLEVLTRTDLGDGKATRETIDLVVDELDHMGGLIERLSVLGQAMEPDSLTVEQLELSAFLNEIHDACPVLADRRWVLRPIPVVCFAGDAGKLRGAVLNLVDNAVKATSRGEPIELSASVDGSHIRICIGDSGKGIPAAQRAAVLRRFSRPGGRDADGSGLGLAIVKAVAEAHGGTVEVGSSTLGGAQVAIVIPIGVQERDAGPDR